ERSPVRSRSRDPEGPPSKPGAKLPHLRLVAAVSMSPSMARSLVAVRPEGAGSMPRATPDDVGCGDCRGFEQACAGAGAHALPHCRGTPRGAVGAVLLTTASKKRRAASVRGTASKQVADGR